MLYTIPDTYNSYYNLCRDYHYVNCSQFMALFNINVSDIVILAVFSIAFNILIRKYIRFTLLV